jgi:hypothetical protein
MHKGSCLCGAVAYEVDGPLGDITYCHCSRCRKAGGAAFAAVSAVNTADFRIVKGQDALKTYRTDGGVERIFCSHCGSPLITKRATQPEIVRLRIGSLDTPVGKKVATHIFVGSKADWDDILDAAPQHMERP